MTARTCDPNRVLPLPRLLQVLLAQGGQVPMNSQHLAQLQQYYNSLGHLQDDAYVIEAPSFIVPYVMEGKPKVRKRILGDGACMGSVFLFGLF